MSRRPIAMTQLEDNQVATLFISCGEGAHMRVGRRCLGMAALLAASGLANAQPAAAAETINYTYDAKGRLVKVAHSGTVNNNVMVDYGHDKADNRTVKKVTGAPTSAARFLFVPIGGMQPIPINR